MFIALSSVAPTAKEPHAGAQDVPLCVRVQLRPKLAESFWTLDVKSCVTFNGTVAEVGERETMSGVMVTVSVADLLGSEMSVAVMVAVAVLVTVAGASYSTDMLSCLLRLPGPESDQVTPLPEESLVVLIVKGTD